MESKAHSAPRAVRVAVLATWAHAALTVVLVLGLLGTAFSFSSPTPAPLLYKSLNAASWLLGPGAVAFLWAPAPARAFFAARTRPVDGAA